MIHSRFQMGGEQVSVIVDKNNLMFANEQGSITTIQGLKLNYDGVLKEHPDLKDDDDWRLKSIERLKEHIKKFNSEMQKVNYVKNELAKFGYTPLFYQKAGWRPIKFK